MGFKDLTTGKVSKCMFLIDYHHTYFFLNYEKILLSELQCGCYFTCLARLCWLCYSYIALTNASAGNPSKLAQGPMFKSKNAQKLSTSPTP